MFFFVGGGGSSACAQNDGQQMLRAASKRFLTEDEARQEQGKQTQGIVSAVKRSGTRDSTRVARNTRAAPQRTQFHQSIARELRGKRWDSVKIQSVKFQSVKFQSHENDEGLDSAAAIAFGNLLCEKKPIDWCEA